MKFGLFYEHQLPKPWADDSERNLFQETLSQVELGDQLGFDHVWAVEHHFLEEYSHLSAPEIFLAACSQRTQSIRLGHGVVIMVPNYNHPVRVAERLATLDLISGGRVDWGTGESSSAMELGGFNVPPQHKKAMWRETTEQVCNMMTMDPYPGFQGQYFSMPCRNILPKPMQKPHPPLWLACGQRETIRQAARNGMGVISTCLLELNELEEAVKEYYDIIKSDECVPIGHSVNANFAMVVGFNCHADPVIAQEQCRDGINYFYFGLSHYFFDGEHSPGESNIWDRFVKNQPLLAKLDLSVVSPVGTPTQIEAYLDKLSAIGVDQAIFMQQMGNMSHADICSSMRLFAETVMPKFKFAEFEREMAKNLEMKPYIDAALRRRRVMPERPSDASDLVRAHNHPLAQKER